MKYRIVACTSLEEVERLVNLLISEGWQPLGGIAINEYGYCKNNWVIHEAVERCYYAQAMMLIDKP